MPIYEYKCENGHVFDELQRMADDPLTQCGVCDAPCERVMHPIAVHFKGSGFYTTDYGSQKSPAGAGSEGGSSDSGSSDSGDSGSSESSGSSDSSSSSESSGSVPSETKGSEKKAEPAKSSTSADD